MLEILDSKRFLPHFYQREKDPGANSTDELSFQLDTDADYILTGFSLMSAQDSDNDTMPSNCEIKLHVENRALMNDWVNQRLFDAEGNFQLRWPVRIPAGTTVKIEFRDTSGGANTIEVVLVGYKDFGA